jgi:hypothetical protein
MSTCDVTCLDGGCKVLCAGDAKCTCSGAGCELSCVGGMPRLCDGTQTCVRAGIGMCP